MSSKSKEPKLTYALDATGRMVFVGDVPRGLSCNCRCPECKEPLVARLGKEGGRQAHFAHRSGSDCHGSVMTALHKLAEQIIAEEQAVMTPEYKSIDQQKLFFERVEVEQRVDRKDLQPDLVGITPDGFRWFIEIKNTHGINEEKRRKIVESNISCLEIDVSEQKLENLNSFLLESAECREWINNPIYDLQIKENEKRKVSKIEQFIFEKRELVVPIDDSNNFLISIKDVSILHKSDDKLFLRLKIISSCNTTYFFNIGSAETISSKEDIHISPDDNELVILTDNLLHDSDVILQSLDIRFIYFHYTREILNAFKNDKRYDVFPMSYCYSNCQYRRYHRECIYEKYTFEIDGEEYVVCDKIKKQKDKL